MYVTCWTAKEGWESVSWSLQALWNWREQDGCKGAIFDSILREMKCGKPTKKPWCVLASGLDAMHWLQPTRRGCGSKCGWLCGYMHMMPRLWMVSMTCKTVLKVAVFGSWLTVSLLYGVYNEMLWPSRVWRQAPLLVLRSWIMDIKSFCLNTSRELIATTGIIVVYKYIYHGEMRKKKKKKRNQGRQKRRPHTKQLWTPSPPSGGVYQ